MKIIGEILENNYTIPTYQRGYRWTPNNVTELLDDIFEASMTSQNSYCLQPIVVKKVDNNTFRVIDGQQRLKTIFLIAQALEIKTEAIITYEKPEEQESQFRLDSLHEGWAIKAIDNWIKSPPEAFNKDSFRKFFLEKVSVIWHMPDENESEQAIFARLNIGKIPLLNSELIRAFLLGKDNTVEKESNIDQIQLATEWDYVEHCLHDVKFRSYIGINKASEPFIDAFFNKIYGGKNKPDPYFTFNYFYNDIKQEQNKDNKISKKNIWQNIYENFLTIKEWYDKKDASSAIIGLVFNGILKKENELYLGDKPLKTLNKNIDVIDKIKTALDWLKGTKALEEHVSKITYQNNEREFLYLTNACYCGLRKISFPFELISEGIDVEHISSKTENDYSKEEDQEAFRTAISNIAKRFKDYCEDFLQKNFQVNDFKEYYNSVKDHSFLKLFIGDFNEGNKDQIGNLVLLHNVINRSYKNTIFLEKKRIIAENIDKVFPLTQAIFFKSNEHFNKCNKDIKQNSDTESKFDTFAFSWTNQDAEAHKNYLIELISKVFFPQIG